MTEAEAIAEIRRKSRVTSNVATSAILRIKINNAQKEFAHNVHGLYKEDYLQVGPMFDTETHFAIRITITGGTNALAATDVALTATARSNAAGGPAATASTVAYDFQAKLRAAIGGGATATVEWSVSTWKFTISGIDCTSITLADPTDLRYASALDLLGFAADTTTAISVTSSIPIDSTVEVGLPSDYVSMTANPEWDGDELTLVPWQQVVSPQTGIGDPCYYSILGNRLRLSPAPSKNKMLHIWYKYLPADVSDSVTSIQVDDDWAMAIVYHSSASIAEDNSEYVIADRMWAQYKRIVSEFTVSKSNDNPKYEQRVKQYNIPKVVF